MQMPDAPPSVHQALEEFHQLLLVCSLDPPPPRHLPVRYQICRTALLRWEMNYYLPGFVRQCVSSLKFREFIHLYDNDPGVRAEFVELSMRKCWEELGALPSASRSGPHVPRGRGPSNASPSASDPSASLSPTKSFDDFMADPDDLAHDR